MKPVGQSVDVAVGVHLVLSIDAALGSAPALVRTRTANCIFYPCVYESFGSVLHTHRQEEEPVNGSSIMVDQTSVGDMPHDGQS